MSLGSMRQEVGRIKRRMPRHAVTQPSDQSIKLIPLTRGKDALVDASLYEWLNQWNWCAQYVAKRGCYYAIRRRDGDGLLFMHGQILDTVLDVDHKNLNTLDNRESNLRPASRSCNLANRPKQRNNMSGYKGVFFNTQHGKWQSSITVKYKTHYLGLFDDPAVAARVYDDAARDIFGAFAHCNFSVAESEVSRGLQ